MTCTWCGVKRKEMKKTEKPGLDTLRKLKGAAKLQYIWDYYKLPLFLIFLSDITYGMFCYIALYLLQGKFELPYYFMKIIVPEAVYTILISVLLYPLLLWIHKRLTVRERGIKEIV